jgi:leucyl aminopeptidase
MTSVKVNVTNPLDTKTSLLAITTTEYEKRIPKSLEAFDALCGGQISAALADFSGKTGQALLCYTNGRPQRLFVIGLGERRKVDGEAIRKAAGKAAGKAQSLKCSEMAFVLPDGMRADDASYAATEGLLLGSYVFNRYQTIDPKPDTLKEATLLVASKGREAAVKAATRASTVAWGTLAVREMVNTPASDWTPETFARTATKWGKEYGYKVEVKGPAELRKEGFGGILAVGSGSANTPRFVRMDYRHGKGDPIVLVGKGITFDTGGISIKPAADMDQMKGDMMGAAIVLATMTVAARLKLKVNLTGLICTAENMPSSTAYRPGDVVKTYGGKTIEVLNTDAEGRVVLADGLGYGATLKPRAMIDFATLTGAIIIALGHRTAGVFGTNQKLISDLVKSGKKVSERLWQLPLTDEHDELVKSEVADVKNSSGRPAASSAAAAFLKTFTNGAPWAHLDIAGVDLEFKGLDYIPKGGTGFGVRLLIDYLSRQSR